ncbi:MAG: saccharopine dehydrogenase NADP-binding domain-containing protein, partial [Frankia sp.]|nr:saccharopine dehydrogenase NADP-binding domain-containing protein [Frankia sp.]
MVGGYGALGRVVSSRLARWYPGRVVIAGRNLAGATALARDFAPGVVEPRLLDVDGDLGPALADAAAVISCVERANVRLAQHCLSSGVHYVDVAATAAVLDAVELLDPLAVQRGSTAVLSVGLAPGLTNLLARRCVNQLPSANAVDIAVLLGLGGDHGPDAVRWTLAHLGRREHPIDADGRPVRRRRVDLPGFGRRTVHSFAFSDQFSLRRTLNPPKNPSRDSPNLSVRTWLCFDSAPATAALFAARAAGLFDLSARLGANEALARATHWLAFGTDHYAIRVTASDPAGSLVSHAIAGRGESVATGTVAAHVTRFLLDRSVPAGVFHIDELVDAEQFVAAVLADLPDQQDPTAASP